jgi:hypothetical protein
MEQAKNQNKGVIMKEVVCPQCYGTGHFPLPAFPHKKVLETPIEELKVFFKCDMCNGKGLATEEVYGWIADGELLKDRRIAKRICLRNAPEILNIDIQILSKMERGCIKPDMDINY